MGEGELWLQMGEGELRCMRGVAAAAHGKGQEMHKKSVDCFLDVDKIAGRKQWLGSLACRINICKKILPTLAAWSKLSAERAPSICDHFPP